jgi:hypothetical protein
MDLMDAMKDLSRIPAGAQEWGSSDTSGSHKYLSSAGVEYPMLGEDYVVQRSLRH